MKVSVIIPAYNEADRIVETIHAVRSVPQVNEILVVDDGSEDETASTALRTGVRVVWHQTNCGKGQALRTGLQSVKADIVVFVDADIGRQAAEIHKLIEPLVSGAADMTIAVLPPVPSKMKGFGLVKGLARWGIEQLTSFTPEAPLSGQRALTKNLLSRLHLSDGFGVEVAMTIDALLQGYRVMEVPVEMHNREYGKSLAGFIHRGRQFLHVALAIVQRWNHVHREPQEGMELNK